MIFDLFFIITVAIVIILVFWIVVYGTKWIVVKSISWLWGLLRRRKNKEEQTVEVSWSEADKRHFESFKEAVKYHDI